MNILRIIGLVAIICLQGCAGVGVIQSSDPEVKISDAKHLMRYPNPNRPLIAERLIRETITICNNSKSEKCLGNAYNAYGWFFQEESVSRYTHVYKKQGFLHPTATYETRYKMAEEYFRKAEGIQKDTLQHDKLTNTYFGLGVLYSYYLLKPELACAAYSKSEKAYLRNIESNPQANVTLPEGYSTYSDFLAPEKEKAGCNN